MEFRGIGLAQPINRLASGFCAVAVNVRAYLRGSILPRTALTDAILTVGDAIQTIHRLNDSTPAGPVAGFTYNVKDSAGNLYTGITGTLTASAIGLSTNPVSIVSFRPNTSVQPWDYLSDSAPSPNVLIVADSFHCAGMLKVRSDGRVRKMGVAEPQAAPVVSFPGGGSGPSQIFYNYVYRASETGALSNPSPVSVPGTNSQSNPTETIPATSHPNFVFNAAQYEFNGTQIRTTGSVGVGVTTDFVSVNTMGFAIPDGVTIDGIQIDLNWIGQNAGTGKINSAALFYLGNPYGNAKFPGIQNQAFSSDALLGGNGDAWGAVLTPAIVNDPTFGFGVQITTQSSGGSDRSFINSMGITVYYSTQNSNITPTASLDPQVDKIDFYRQGGGLANPTYVGTGPNTATAFNDTLSDLAAAANPTLQFDNFEPFPSIDLPRKGTLTASGQVLTSTSGDPFNIRWLPGTIMQIGTPDQIAYTAVRRPTSTTSWDFTNNDPTVPVIPDGTGLVWNIAEPDLAQQSLPYMFGITDNINFVFAVGDPLRPGTLYWCKGNNLDSAPDTNQLEVTDPGEPLVNGAMSNGLGVLFSIKRAWIIEPNFYNALATAIGDTGSTWSLQATAINRGLFIPRCVAVEGGGRIFFRVDDGILISIAGGAPQSITDQSLYPLFSHEGSTPQSITRNGVTFVPPDDTQPQQQQFSIQNGYLYYAYLGMDAARHVLVFDILSMAWVWDVYSTMPITYAPNEGQSVQGILAGCTDHTLRMLSTSGSETVTSTVVTPAFGSAGFQFVRQLDVEYQSNDPVTLSFVATDISNNSYAPQPITLPSTGGVPTKTRFQVSPNKTQWMQLRFDSTDPSLQVYLEGLCLIVRTWGLPGPFRQVFPFANDGGHGPQP